MTAKIPHKIRLKNRDAITPIIIRENTILNMVDSINKLIKSRVITIIPVKLIGMETGKMVSINPWVASVILNVSVVDKFVQKAVTSPTE